MQNKSKLRKLISILPYLILAELLLAVLWSHYPDVRLILTSGRVVDDSFYYYKVAYNIMHGGGMTFDGINLTNGFQPLWLVLNLPIFYMSDKFQDLRMVLHLEEVVLVLGALVSLRFLQRIGAPLIGSFLIIFLTITATGFIPHSVLGLETCLYILCFASALLCLYRVTDESEFTKLNLIFAGTALSVLSLARTDSLMFSLLVSFYLLWRLHRMGNTSREMFTQFLYFIAPFVIIVLPYLVSNYLLIGELMPVSGAVKRLYSKNNLQMAIDHGATWLQAIKHNILLPLELPDRIFCIYLFIANFLIGLIYLVKGPRVLLLFQIFLVVKYLTYGVIFYDHSLYSWYYAMDFFGPAFFIPLFYSNYLTPFVNRQFGRRIALPLYVVILCALIIYSRKSYWAEIERVKSHKNAFNAEAGPMNDLEFFYFNSLALNEAPLSDSFTMGMHNCGVFGYFSRYHVVNFDGLINGRTRLKYIKKYFYNFLPYLDEAQPIDAYTDSIDVQNITAYQGYFTTRGFQQLDLRDYTERHHGESQFSARVRFPIFVSGKYFDLVKTFLEK